MGQLNDVERLALAQALYKMAGELVDTKNPDSLRSEVDRNYRELYIKTGAKSFEIHLNGEQVGTYSIRVSKPKDAETHTTFEVTDYEKLAKWFDTREEDGYCEVFAAQNLAQFAEYVFEDSGEMPDGCELQTVVTPAIDKQYLGGTLKVDVESVINAMGEQLPPSIAGLLEG